MSRKTIMVLQIISFALYVLALLFCIVSIFFQRPIKELFASASDVLAYKTAPYNSLIACTTYVILSLTYMIVSGGAQSRRTIFDIGITIAVLFGLFETLILPFVPTAVTAHISKYGIIATAAYQSLESFVSLVIPLVISPANILMLISIGGLLGKAPAKG